ncbi:hypothetical protein E2C01_012706 [Portunus trituberculatus]|uniref:Uncharacterized protein n=1 Tax=Portunus trituberculatus TaxID=210409 RepID=A0A5B7DEL1_PORTR|nr:hypothetical protein [Portunus trituberculatus]
MTHNQATITVLLVIPRAVGAAIHWHVHGAVGKLNEVILVEKHFQTLKEFFTVVGEDLSFRVQGGVGERGGWEGECVVLGTSVALVVEGRVLGVVVVVDGRMSELVVVDVLKGRLSGLVVVVVVVVMMLDGRVSGLVVVVVVLKGRLSGLVVVVLVVTLVVLRPFICTFGSTTTTTTTTTTTNNNNDNLSDEGDTNKTEADKPFLSILTIFSVTEHRPNKTRKNSAAVNTNVK